ncbi:DDB1- and CUL4-associated factor 4 isoform X2 [Salvia hispanica]|uniref:DDB1- and CUL4-associated factor 4 isoform X2 n=1 Tax=Salvia hispanica TaxID=49212 RepID=UPI0020095102|nr:DDB1- and CUL4-associated factor 4 isoform X2 [Salvia hispanica]
MPKELPGFYYDEEKKRYFAHKGPIPGSSRKPPPPNPPPKADSSCQSVKLRQKLIQSRELWGNVIFYRKEKFNFQSFYQKCHASQPMIWKYGGTKRIANVALGHVVADVSSQHGLTERDILVSVGANGLLCIFPVGKTEEEVDPMENHMVDLVWPLNSDTLPRRKELVKELGSSYGSTTCLASEVSSLMSLRKSCLPADILSKYFLITTLGSENTSGSVYLLDLSKPLHFGASVQIQEFHELASFKQTIWAADCDREGNRAAIGTNRGVMLLNMETGGSSRVFDCKSDVLSVQLVQAGRVIICGLRNKAILTVDTRQKQIKRRINKSLTTSMSSSVCCLSSLDLWDQYFLASSMDGSIKLYDHRLMQRGPVQSYEGNVNTHTSVKLGIDPSEKVVMSGGEDCYTRLWDIKTGEMLLEAKFMNSIPAAVCWPRRGAFTAAWQDHRNYWQDHSLGAWLGSYEGIYYMDWL